MIIVERQSRRRFGPSLTPLIDVVFLLLVFFMLAARFGAEDSINLSLGGGSAAYEGPPRLVTVGPEDVMLNGVVIPVGELSDALARLMKTPSDIVVLRLDKDADLQSFVDTAMHLHASGLGNLAVVE